MVERLDGKLVFSGEGAAARQKSFAELFSKSDNLAPAGASAFSFCELFLLRLLVQKKKRSYGLCLIKRLQNKKNN